MLSVQSTVTETQTKIDALTSNLNVVDVNLSVLTAQAKRQISTTNQIEQHSRNECLRIKDLPLDEQKMHDNHYVKKTVYAQVLAPILKAAADDPNDSLEEVPAMNLLLKNAHILPKPRNAPDSAPNPILVRLNMMDVRHKIFKYKKKVLSAPGCPRILEDLTSINSTVLSSLFLNKEIDSAWSLQGAIFYTKASDQSQKKKRYRVYDVFEFLSDDDLRRLKISLPRVSKKQTNAGVGEEEEAE